MSGNQPDNGHTPGCWAMPECDVCGLRKKPRGRDAGVAAANGYCGEDCKGYNQEPLSGHFWPEETSDGRQAMATEQPDHGRRERQDAELEDSLTVPWKDLAVSNQPDDGVPERIYIQKDLSFFHAQGNGTYYRDPDDNSIPFIPLSVADQRVEDMKAAMIAAIRGVTAFSTTDEYLKAINNAWEQLEQRYTRAQLDAAVASATADLNTFGETMLRRIESLAGIVPSAGHGWTYAIERLEAAVAELRAEILAQSNLAAEWELRYDEQFSQARSLRASQAEAVAERDTEIERLTCWVSDLQSEMYVNCVYCGHRYGPEKDTPVAIADVLKAHIEQCPKHPMSALRASQAAEIERLTDNLALAEMRESVHPAEVAKAKRDTWDKAIDVTKGEHLHDDTGTDSDAGYDQAITDVVSALEAARTDDGKGE